MFSQLLWICQEVSFQGFIFFSIGAAFARAGDGTNRNFIVHQPHQNLRACADDLEVAVIKKEHKWRGVHAPQRPIHGERRQCEVLRPALGRHHLEDISGFDVILRFFNSREVALFGEI